MSSPSLLILLALAGCRGCFTPDLPDQEEPDETDTHDTADTGDTADTVVDTGPPPPCDVPEAEDNNALDRAQDLPMEQWACGALLEYGDLDTFRFATAGPGWVKVWVRGDAENGGPGTLADLQLTVQTISGDYFTLSTSSSGSNDPIAVFPLDQAETLYATVADQFYGWGEDNVWELMASSVKAPVSWTTEEVESNNSQAAANPIQSGDRVYAVIDAASDYDWYSIELPDAKSDITARIYAWNYGSPVDVSVQLWSPSKTDGATKTSHVGVHNYDLDPILTHSASEGGTWTIKVDDASGGGETYWYVLEVEVVTEDTGL